MSSDHIWPILFFVSLAGNLILLFYRPLLRLLRRGEEVSEDEIMAMVEEGEESGAIERNEKELIENVFEFNNTTAEDVMIHRTDMVTLSLDDDEETILSAIRESGLSRFPVYQENLWRVSGSADLEELAEAMDFQLPEDEDRDYDTLGGLVFAQLAVIPEDGSRPVVEALGLRIRVEELCDRRVEWALVEKQAPAAAACE